MAKRLKVTQTRSLIGNKEGAKRTIAALGLRRMHHSVVVADTPENRGMINKVSYLLQVEEV